MFPTVQGLIWWESAGDRKGIKAAGAARLGQRRPGPLDC